MSILKMIFTFFLRVFLTLMAIGLILGLLVVVAFLGLRWLIQSLWAKITGKPVKPWTQRYHFGQSWNNVFDQYDPSRRNRDYSSTNYRSRENDIIDVAAHTVMEPWDESHTPIYKGYQKPSKQNEANQNHSNNHFNDNDFPPRQLPKPPSS